MSHVQGVRAGEEKSGEASAAAAAADVRRMAIKDDRKAQEHDDANMKKQAGASEAGRGAAHRRAPSFNKQQQHVMQKLQQIQVRASQLREQPHIRMSDVHALQDGLREVESYKTENIWLGSLASGRIPEGQAAMQESFERTAEQVRTLVLRAEEPAGARAASSAQDEQDDIEMSASLKSLYHQLCDIRKQLASHLSSAAKLDGDALSHVYWLQYQLNHLECTHKDASGIWMGDITKGKVPAGQARIQEEVEACHRIAHQINIAREERAGDKTLAKKPEHMETTMWKDLKLVSPNLRPLYTQLSDIDAQVKHWSEKAHAAGPAAVKWGQVRHLQVAVNDLEEQWRQDGIWRAPHAEQPSSKPAGKGAKEAPASAASRPSGAAAGEGEVHATPFISAPIESGQAILSILVSNIHHRLERLREHQPASGEEAQQGAAAASSAPSAAKRA